MFLQRPLKEFPSLVEQYREYCEENDLDYMESDFRNFRAFFHSLYITIRVEEQEERFLSEAVNYRVDPDQNNPLRSFTEDRRKAEYDAVYLGFSVLSQDE